MKDGGQPPPKDCFSTYPCHLIALCPLTTTLPRLPPSPHLAPAQDLHLRRIGPWLANTAEKLPSSHLERKYLPPPPPVSSSLPHHKQQPHDIPALHCRVMPLLQRKALVVIRQRKHRGAASAALIVPPVLPLVGAKRGGGVLFERRKGGKEATK